MSAYFQSENRIKLHDFEEYQLPVLQEREKLQLQTETNASILAAEKQEYYLPDFHFSCRLLVLAKGYVDDEAASAAETAALVFAISRYVPHL